MILENRDGTNSFFAKNSFMWFSRKEKISYLRHDFTEKENGLLSQKHGKNMKMNIFVQLYLKCGKRPTQKWLLQLIFLKQNMFH